MPRRGHRQAVERRPAGRPSSTASGTGSARAPDRATAPGSRAPRQARRARRPRPTWSIRRRLKPASSVRASATAALISAAAAQPVPRLDPELPGHQLLRPHDDPDAQPAEAQREQDALELRLPAERVQDQQGEAGDTGDAERRQHRSLARDARGRGWAADRRLAQGRPVRRGAHASVPGVVAGGVAGGVAAAAAVRPSSCVGRGAVPRTCRATNSDASSNAGRPIATADEPLGDGPGLADRRAPGRGRRRQPLDVRREVGELRVVERERAASRRGR